MATQPPSAELVAEFEEEVDTVALDLVEKFEWLGLPDGTQLEDLHAELSDAIGKILKPWL